jgi:hypothetical protein
MASAVGIASSPLGRHRDFTLHGIQRSAKPRESPHRPAESVIEFHCASVAYAKGFFREEGIDAEIVRIATNIGIVAVTTKEIAYTTAVGAGMTSQHGLTSVEDIKRR